MVQHGKFVLWVDLKSPVRRDCAKHIVGGSLNVVNISESHHITANLIPQPRAIMLKPRGRLSCQPLRRGRDVYLGWPISRVTIREMDSQLERREIRDLERVYLWLAILSCPVRGVQTRMSRCRGRGEHDNNGRRRLNWEVDLEGERVLDVRTLDLRVYGLERAELYDTGITAVFVHVYFWRREEECS